jgi:hypothetical protein
MLSTDKEDLRDCYKKPLLHEARMGTTSENSNFYKTYKYIPKDIDEVVEYFKFEEMRKQGFASRFLTKNPYEEAFYDYIEKLNRDYNHLPKSVAHARVLNVLADKHEKALVSKK